MRRLMLFVGLLAMAGLVFTAVAESNKPPSQGAVDFATRTADLMTATLFAALIQEFDETTPANVQEGIQSIGLIFHDENTSMRLVGTFQPLSRNDYPMDSFEAGALAKALTGQPDTTVERVKGDWYYRRSIPLSNFRVECSMCHQNFPSVPSATDWVGALMLNVPIK